MTLINLIPEDKLLIETDSPYLTPEPFRGTENEPYNVYLVAKKISEIVLKLQNKPINIKTDEDTNLTTITCEKSKFELNSIGASEYLQIFSNEDVELDEDKEFEINKETFNKAIKQTMYCCAQAESASILGGVCVNIKENTLEVAATDGNRLTRVIKAINSKSKEETFVIPLKTLQEVARISSIVEDKNLKIKIKKSKIYFLFENLKYSSKLIEGIYPKYQQLIPTNNDKIIELKKEDLINSIERVAVMVNEKTSIVKKRLF